MANYLGAVGIKLKVTPMERATVLKANQEKKLTGLNVGGSAAFGNAATRIEAYVGRRRPATCTAAIPTSTVYSGASRGHGSQTARGDAR